MRNTITFLVTLFFSISIFSQGNGYLGITIEKASERGVRISDVLENGSAKVYGLKQNDIILSIDGNIVSSIKELKSQVKKKNWGETISINYIRNGNDYSQNVVLGNRVNRITYHIKRDMMSKDNSTWNFDENTWVNIENGQPKWIKKKFENGITQTYVVESFRETPQAFSDLDDKLEIIDVLIQRNAGKRYFPSITVYIKTYPEKSKIKVESNNNSKLTVYPNPSLGMFKFSLNMKESKSKALSWQIFDITGKNIMDGNINNFSGTTTQEFDLTNQDAGVYLLRIVNDKEVMTERLIIK